MNDMSAEFVRQIQERAEKSSEGPWYCLNTPETQCVSDTAAHTSRDAIVHWTGFDASDKSIKRKRANAAFIAHSREDVPRLCESWLEQSATIVLLREALERVKEELTIPAAEYVPAIPDCWKIIDAALSALPEQAGVSK